MGYNSTEEEARPASTPGIGSGKEATSGPPAGGGRPWPLGRPRVGRVLAVSQVIAVGLIAAGLSACSSASASPSSSPSSGDPAPSGGPVSTTRPAGLVADGPLDIGCKVTSHAAEVTLWNPGSSAQAVSALTVNFDSQGNLISQNQLMLSVSVAPGTGRTETMTAPSGATTCSLAWWNP